MTVGLRWVTRRMAAIAMLGTLGITLVACTDFATRRDATVPTLALRPGSTLVVIGVQPATDQPQREESRVGFGLTHLVAETLFRTGKFQVLEEKTVHQRALLNALIRTYWVESHSAYALADLQHIGAQLRVALLAYGHMARARVSKRAVEAGLFTHVVQWLQMHVQVCLYVVATQAVACSEGQGEAAQTGWGMVYVFDGERLAFEQSTVGLATQKAVAQAVDRLIAQSAFTPEPQ